MTQRSETSMPAAKPGPLFSPLAAMAVIAAVTALRLLYLLFYPFDLHPDEAQYWSWSRDLAWGYFSKPPVVAWLIAATTAVCGDGEACIKASVPLLHGAAACLIYGTARRLYDGRAAFFASVLYLSLPGVTFSSSIMSTDPPLLACWAAALYALVRLGEEGGKSLQWWILLGIAVGLGLLAKYAMAYFALGFVLWLALDGTARRNLLGHRRGKAGLAAAAAIAFAWLAPNLFWNMGTGYVTFAHTAANASLGGPLFNPDELGAFVASQFGVFGPIAFAVLLGLVLIAPRWRTVPGGPFLASFVLAPLVPVFIVALLSRAHANWAAAAYVAGSVWVAGALAQGKGRIALWASIALHGAFAAALMAGSIGQEVPGRYAGYGVPAKLDAYRNYGGWRELGAEVTALSRRFPGAALLPADRMTLAALLYYARPVAGMIRAWHPGGTVGHHFELTRPYGGPAGSDALVFLRRGEARTILSRFRNARELPAISVRVSTAAFREVRVFHATGFLGYKPAQP